METALNGLSDDVLALFAAVRPVVDTAYLVQLASRVLHILSAIILVGGLFYIRSILRPSGEEACFAGRRAVWARWVALTTFLLIITGIYNMLAIINQAKAAGEPVDSTYHALIGGKILLGLGVMFIMAVLAGKTALAEKFRANMGKWLTIAWMAAVGIVAIAAVLKTYH